MAVERIVEYGDILKVILKPTSRFPINYFYCNFDVLDLLDSLNWFSARYQNSIYIIAHSYIGTCLFHKELFRFYNNCDWSGEIDHINSVGIDNTDNNLNAVTSEQNKYNKLVRGYFYRQRDGVFSPHIVINTKSFYPYRTNIKSEAEACILQSHLEQVWLREQLGDEWYMFDFKKYRRGSEDILDLERTGQISEEEAIYRHILRYADNAWYYLRYNLEEYFRDNHIPVPQYSLDERGFMIHPVTGQKLCPIKYSGGRG